MGLKNYMEDVVTEVCQEYLKANPEYCSCERCMADTIAIALTKLKGKYAVSLEGEIFTKVSCEERQVRADALIVVIEASQLVRQQPNH